MKLSTAFSFLFKNLDIHLFPRMTYTRFAIANYINQTSGI